MTYPFNYINQILLGDCLDLMPQIPDKSIDMVLADLPYGMTNQNKWDSIIPMDKLWGEYNRVIKDNGAIVLNAMQPFSSKLMAYATVPFKYEWIWVKENTTGFLNAKKQPLRKHESILVFYKEQCLYNPQMGEGKPYKGKTGHPTSNYGKFFQIELDNKGTRYPTSILNFPRDAHNKLHPTQKPVALMEYLIKTYTNEGEIVLDNCCGSGSSLVGCRNLNRRFVGMERDEAIFEVAKTRLGL